MKRIEQKNTIKKKKHEKGRKLYQKGAELLWPVSVRSSYRVLPTKQIWLNIGGLAVRLWTRGIVLRDAGAYPPVLSPLLLLVRLTLYPTRQPVRRLPYTSYLNWMSTPFLPWRWSDFSHAPDRGFHLFASRTKRVCWVSSLFLCIILFVNTYLKFYIIFFIFLRWNEEALGVIQAPSVMISLTRPFTRHE